jgi:DNA anti-recombination protein RmuC
MTDLNSYGYSDGPKGFWSHTEQINWHIDKFRDTNEAALDRNTDAIKEQTEQQRIDAEALRQTIDRQTAQQKADAEEGRNVFSRWMGDLIGSFKKIFSKDTDDSNDTYFEMMEKEQKRMQEYVANHTSTVKSNADTTNARLQNIISELQKIQTNDDENANAIKNAINNLDLVVNNKIEYPRN